MGRGSEEIICKVLTIREALWLASLVVILLLIPPFSEPQFPSVDKRLRIPALSRPPYLWMLPFSKIHATNKKTSAAMQSRITLISETGSHVFEPPASWVVIRQKEAHQKVFKGNGGHGEKEDRCLQWRDLERGRSGLVPTAVWLQPGALHTAQPWSPPGILFYKDPGLADKTIFDPETWTDNFVYKPQTESPCQLFRPHHASPRCRTRVFALLGVDEGTLGSFGELHPPWSRSPASQHGVTAGWYGSVLSGRADGPQLHVTHVSSVLLKVHSQEG